MVAKIKSGKSLIGALNYNENKVRQGKASLIAVAGYLKDGAELSFQDKLFRLTDLAAMNQRAKTNTVHISLNFPNGELLNDATLSEIVSDYLNGIGFQNQPYLIYRHTDAGHPHIHIVTTNIKRDGERISLHNLGKNESEKARRAIEVKYGLIKAEQQPKQKPDLKTAVTVAEYGKSETKRSITNILGYVLRTYKFTSVPELNAILAQYHLQADRGAKDSRLYARAGLLYWLLDKQGNKIGVPIKASTVYGKPTLKNLEGKFRLNEQLRKPLKAALLQTLDTVLSRPQSFQSFQQALSQQGIQCLFRRNADGRLYGVTFVDSNHKVVFNGSDLGKAYSANALSSRLEFDLPTVTQLKNGSQVCLPGLLSIPIHEQHLLEILSAPEQDDQAALRKFKKKKRRGHNL